MSYFSISPLTLQSTDPSNPNLLKAWMQNAAILLNQISLAIVSPVFAANVLNGNNLLSPSAQTFVQVNASITSNQTVDTKRSSLVFIRFTLSAVLANLTITMNNVVDGQICAVSIGNGSASASTITLAANTVTPTAMTVLDGPNGLSSGVSVASGVRVTYVGMASATNLLYVGTGNNW